MRVRSAWLILVSLHISAVQLTVEEPTNYQYQHGAITIPKATADEPKLEKFSLKLALNYLDQGASAWIGSRGCLSCHTSGVYVTVRPALAMKVGEPPQEARRFLESTLQQQLESDRKELGQKLGPAKVIHTAMGLAEWDAHVSKRLSGPTQQALDLMLDIQQENGSWAPPSSCWPPFESDSYHETTMAAMAVQTAPGWHRSLKDPKILTRVERLKHYLRTQSPPHDYGRVWLLRAASRMPDLLTPRQKQELIETVWTHQRSDGGWSLRTFAAPEEWGSGIRAAKLRGESEFSDPPSDGHQTGLAIAALREAGVPAEDPRIQRGVAWLLRNQRVSGRWWTRSLNTDGWHFITYSSTAFAVLALGLCNSLAFD